MGVGKLDSGGRNNLFEVLLDVILSELSLIN